MMVTVPWWFLAAIALLVLSLYAAHYARGLVVAVYEAQVSALTAEVERLKEGRFSEAEFQHLCHNFKADDRRRFEAGCKEYQDKLFGEGR